MIDWIPIMGIIALCGSLAGMFELSWYLMFRTSKKQVLGSVE